MSAWTRFITYMRWPARVVAIPAVVAACALLETFFLYATTSGEFCSYAMSMDMKMEGFKTIWADREMTSCVVLFARLRRPRERDARARDDRRVPRRRTRRGSCARGESSCSPSR